jgi:DNA-binding transcriptional LysR family regulator
LGEEVGFKLFDRLSRGVKLSTAGKLFLEEARRILQQVDDATKRAKRVASGQSGTLRAGFIESMSWHGVVPDSFRQFREQHADAELQIKPLSSLEQIQAVRSGQLDAGFLFTIANIDRELAQLDIALVNLMLAVPKGHPLAKAKALRLRDLSSASFIWFPRRESPFFYDRLMHACFRGGLKSPRIDCAVIFKAEALDASRAVFGFRPTRWRKSEPSWPAQRLMSVHCSSLTRGPARENPTRKL